MCDIYCFFSFFLWCVLCLFFQAEDGIRDPLVTGVQTCALPICCAGPRTWRAASLQDDRRSHRVRAEALLVPLLDRSRALELATAWKGDGLPSCGQAAVATHIRSGRSCPALTADRGA